MPEKCPNYELCQNTKVDGMGSDFCMTCGSWFKMGFGWDKLTFVETTEECVVCMNICDKKLMFPTNCGHAFCISCSKDILFWNQTRYQLSQVFYGCPPCPNGCVNPIKGEQCYCEEYDVVEEEWKNNQPEKYQEWVTAEEKSIKNSFSEVTYGKATCPLCRKKYER
jgi:hypothetical protein